MASNLPSIRRFFDEDFKDAPSWFHQFIGTLNKYAEPIFNILNGGIDISANTLEEIYYLNITNASSIGANNTATFSPKKFVGAPHGITVGQCLLNNTTATIASVTLSWIWNGSQIAIKSVYGLTDGLSYSLTLRIW